MATSSMTNITYSLIKNKFSISDYKVFFIQTRRIIDIANNTAEKINTTRCNDWTDNYF